MILENLKTFIESQGLTMKEVERSAGLSNGVLSKAMNAGTAIRSDSVEKILSAYPELSSQWLLSGEGPMLKTDQPQMIETTDGSGIPLLPVEAMAGQFQGEQEFNLAECPRYNVPIFRKADYLIQVCGDSMQPTFHSGDLVACKNLPLQDIFFQWGKVYVVDTEQGALIKRVDEGSMADTIKLVSDNDRYKPFEIARAAIYHVAIVVGSIHVE